MARVARIKKCSRAHEVDCCHQRLGVGLLKIWWRQPASWALRKVSDELHMRHGYFKCFSRVAHWKKALLYSPSGVELFYRTKRIFEHLFTQNQPEVSAQTSVSDGFLEV